MDGNLVWRDTHTLLSLGAWRRARGGMGHAVHPHSPHPPHAPLIPTQVDPDLVGAEAEELARLCQGVPLLLRSVRAGPAHACAHGLHACHPPTHPPHTRAAAAWSPAWRPARRPGPARTPQCCSPSPCRHAQGTAVLVVAVLLPSSPLPSSATRRLAGDGIASGRLTLEVGRPGQRRRGAAGCCCWCCCAWPCHAHCCVSAACACALLDAVAARAAPLRLQGLEG